MLRAHVLPLVGSAGVLHKRALTHWTASTRMILKHLGACTYINGEVKVPLICCKLVHDILKR